MRASALFYKSKQTKLWEDAKNHDPFKKCAMQSFFGQFHQLKNFFVKNRSFSQMLPRRFSISALVRRKSKLRGGAFPGYRRTGYDTQVV